MITQERLKELVEYRDGKLYWREDRGCVKKGSEAGTVTKLGYIRVSLDRNIYFAHRLIWLYHYGHFPVHNIDHIDQNPANNLLENLRDVPQSENVRNATVGKDNSSGVMGVQLDKRRGRYVVRIREGDKYGYYGAFPTLEEAAVRAKEVYARLGYHENHGRNKDELS